jgi:hypothetical protein
MDQVPQYNNYGFNPVLNKNEWIMGAKIPGQPEIYALDISDFQFSTRNHETWWVDDVNSVHQFAFVQYLESIFNDQLGLVISFLGIKTGKEIVRFYYDDIRSIDEIKMISGYEVIPITD